MLVSPFIFVFPCSYFHFMFHLSVAVLSRLLEYNNLYNSLIVMQLFLTVNRGSGSTQNKLTAIAVGARGWGMSKL